MLRTLKDSRLLYPVAQTIPNKLSITIDGENKTFHEKKFKQYLSSNPSIQKILEEKLQPKEVNHTQENIGN